jgi:hypothetical protein
MYTSLVHDAAKNALERGLSLGREEGFVKCAKTCFGNFDKAVTMVETEFQLSTDDARFVVERCWNK